MAFRLPSAAKLIKPTDLVSKAANGHGAFVPQIRKLVFEYCERGVSSARTRTYLLKNAEELAKTNPHVEVVVKTRSLQQPIVRGLYLNGRDKVIPLSKLECNQISHKVQLLLDSSGAKIKPLKRSFVESSTESPRGIWSGLHVEKPYEI